MFWELEHSGSKTIPSSFDMSRIFSLFFASLLVAFFSVSLPALAADGNPYLIENMAVSINGKSPSAARNTATATARRDAFLILLNRLNLATNVADNVTDEEISDMVRSEIIDNERFAGNNYSATFNITFAKDFVDHILAQKNAPRESQKVEEVKENYVILPVKLVQKKALLWEESNDWKKAVESSIDNKKRANFFSPVADVENLSSLSQENLAKVNYAELEPMLARYKANAAYLLFFSLDETAKKISVEISYLRKMQKKQMKLSFVNIEGMSREAMMLKVADKTMDYIANAQSNKTADLSFTQLRLQIPISSLGNYLLIKGKIENSNLVNSLNIESISRDYVYMSVGYVNSGLEPSEAFAKFGLFLTKKGDDFYQVNLNQ